MIFGGLSIILICVVTENKIWGRSSVGRAFGSHPRGHEFESHRLHQKSRMPKVFGIFTYYLFALHSSAYSGFWASNKESWRSWGVRFVDDWNDVERYLSCSDVTDRREQIVHGDFFVKNPRSALPASSIPLFLFRHLWPFSFSTWIFDISLPPY